MNKFRFTLMALGIMAVTLMVSSAVQAQATRTWVSGVGDDVNPCSRTAPCKTFAGAISKTAKDGEISVLDPGGFGAVTITKSITINGTHGSGYGSILSALTAQGVLINITDVNDIRKTVRLQSLNVNGASSGTNGIRILSALNVYIEDCVLDGFTNRGINDNRSTTGKLVVKDTIVRGVVQSGIVITPTGGSTTTVIMENVSVTGSTSNSGYAQSGSVKSSLKNCIFSGNSVGGVVADGTGGEVTLEGCSISNNGTGIFVTAPAIVRINNNVISNNGTSINAAGAAQVSSTLTNTITGNGVTNPPTGPGIGQT